ncbi:TetR/AcrR family transcriptional regulator [Saccharopolyspora oryzae]|uniref:TetR/AcrR family transcriptional regulator n=1 Tax=Saccharopolyspora oryzae TaxID=2997343 RepID=A0ABT4V6R4_9PSEU|nr:TetR/AcrR family transcriptional regulator [Saccharopolyspora oryzae]MDA3629652.1 TetR/AcrR family transcriptional regulator [Saccharopolyspora oryzae]
MVRPKTHDEALRRTLIELAATVVFESGVKALSLRRLATDAGTSTTAIYSLFGNKAGLLDSVYRDAAKQFAARLALVDTTDDPAADVVKLGLAYREHALANPHLYAVMFSDRFVELDLSAEQKDAGAETFEPLVEAVRRAQASGQFAPAPTEHIALSCWAMAHGLVSLELSGAIPPGLDIAASYEDALRSVVIGWSR